MQKTKTFFKMTGDGTEFKNIFSSVGWLVLQAGIVIHVFTQLLHHQVTF